jgi:hypothetical protein
VDSSRGSVAALGVDAIVASNSSAHTYTSAEGSSSTRDFAVGGGSIDTVDSSTPTHKGSSRASA